MLRNRIRYLNPPARRLVALAVVTALPFLGCGALNPAFLNVVAPEQVDSFASVDNASGHVIVSFINNAEVDERLVDFLETEGGLDLTPVERRNLRPRIRFRMLVTFVDGTQLPLEFISGSTGLIDQQFDASVFPDLNQNDFDNGVVLCNVQSVELLPGAPIEVFVPVQLNVYARENVTDDDFTTEPIFNLQNQIPPQFRELEVDQTDADGNVVLQQNIGIRDVPAPVGEPQCGSVIGIVLNGTLDVPFLDGVDDAPSYDQGDQNVVARIGGRYEFVVSIR